MLVVSICLIMLILTVLLCYIASGLHVSWLIILASLLAFLCIMMYIGFIISVHHGLQRQLVSRVNVVPATVLPVAEIEMVPVARELATAEMVRVELAPCVQTRAVHILEISSA